MKQLFIGLIMVLGTSYAVAKTTIEVAEQKEHYSVFLKNLRVKAQEFLKSLEINMRLDVEALRNRNLMHQSDVLENRDQDIYELIAEKFDNEFEHIDKKFNSALLRLDETNAPASIKQGFVKQLKDQATASIDSLIAHYKKNKRNY